MTGSSEARFIRNSTDVQTWQKPEKTAFMQVSLSCLLIRLPMPCHVFAMATSQSVQKLPLLEGWWIELGVTQGKKVINWFSNNLSVFIILYITDVNTHLCSCYNVYKNKQFPNNTHDQRQNLKVRREKVHLQMPLCEYHSKPQIFIIIDTHALCKTSQQNNNDDCSCRCCGSLFHIWKF